MCCSHYLRCRKVVVLLSRAEHLGWLFFVHTSSFFDTSLWLCWLTDLHDCTLMLRSSCFTIYIHRHILLMVREGDLHKFTPLSVVETSVVMPCCHLYVLCFQALRSDSENYSIKLKGHEKKQKIKKSFTDSYCHSKGFCMEVN